MTKPFKNNKNSPFEVENRVSIGLIGFTYFSLIYLLLIYFSDWQNVRIKLQQHPDFNQYFLESPDEQPWQESDLVDSNETRIPLDILDSSEAEACFEEHKATLETEERRKE